MKQVEIWYNPYRLETKIMVNGQPPKMDSALQNAVKKGKRLQEWVTNFPADLCSEYGCREFSLRFHGMSLDWDDMREALVQSEQKGEIGKVHTEFIEAPSDEEIKEKIVKIFHDLQNGPIDAFKDETLLKAFMKLSENKFPINVIATMSSGKSTLINAMLGTKLMPAKNEACTATITEITDTDAAGFSAEIYNAKNELIETIHRLTYEQMTLLNDRPDVRRICAQGDIPFVDAKGTALMLVDTPGPNNSKDDSHRETTYQAIANGSNNLILYVLNGTQLSTNDDHSLLSYVAEQIQKGGKQARDRFLFVINKMDQFNPEEEDIGKAVQAARDYLGSFGIEDPQIYPCSAYTALNIRTLLKGIDVENLSRSEIKKLDYAARETIDKIDVFNEIESMHLEQYSTLTPTAQRVLQERLDDAIKRDDTKEQALIHCGVLSIEAAIVAYVKKYALTKMVKDLVEQLEAVLEAQHVFARAKEAITENEKLAESCRKRAETVMEQISNGEASAEFRKKVEELNPITEIQRKAYEKRDDILAKIDVFFSGYDQDYVFENSKEARKVVEGFAKCAEEIVYPLSTDLNKLIDEEIRNKGVELLTEYQEYLAQVDANAGCSELDFNTSALIGDKLKQMEDAMVNMTSIGYALGKVEEVGEIYEEDEIYIEKIGTEEIQVKVGSHKEKVDTKLVKVGEHREKVGTQRVRNSDRRFLQFWKPKYVEVDVYQTVSDYEEQDVYATVDDYETQVRDIFEERTRKVERFRLEYLKLQGELLLEFSKTINDALQKTMEGAEEQATELRAYFQLEFKKLDDLIAQKYEELLEYNENLELRRKELERTKQICAWLELNMRLIHDIMDLKEVR